MAVKVYKAKKLNGILTQLASTIKRLDPDGYLGECPNYDCTATNPCQTCVPWYDLSAIEKELTKTNLLSDNSLIITF